jgi:hypothetical protein
MNFEEIEPFVKDIIELQKKYNLTVILDDNLCELRKLCGGINIFFTNNPSPLLNESESGLKIKTSRSGKVIRILKK